MNKKERQQQLDEFHKKMELNGMLEAVNRARSVTVGTCFGGTVEISMRRADGTTTFAIMQPVEVIELIHQLSAQVGCHIHIRPRQDFASWRDWKYTEEELAHYRGPQMLPGVGHAPPTNDMATHMQVGANLPLPEKQPGLQPAMMAKREEHEQAVATKKTVNRRNAKRSAAAAR